MAVLGSKYNLKKEENFTNILYNLLEVHGKKYYARYGFGKKLKGYGVKQSEFSEFENKAHPTSERKFREYKEELIHRGFIEKFYTKNKKAGRPFYKITPIGIVYLVKNIDRFTKNTVTSIYKILIDYSNPNDSTMIFDSKLWKFFTTEQLDQALKQVGYFTEVLLEKYFTGLRFDFYLFKSKNRTRVFQGVVTPTGFVEEKTWLLSHDSRDLDNGLNVKRDRFYHQISYSFNIMLSYYLVHTLEDMDKLKKMPNPFRQLVATSFNHIFDDLEWSRTKEKYVEIITSL